MNSNEKPYPEGQTVYCFISSALEAPLDKLTGLGLLPVAQWTSGNRTCGFFCNFRLGRPLVLRSLNEQGDYSAEELTACIDYREFPVHNGDSLVSLAYSGSSRFGCMTDFWGIMNHFWSCDEDAFICSNDLFLVEHLKGGGGGISEESLFEYLFFLAPLEDCTWFEGIRTLLPDQKLLYDWGKHSVRLSPRRSLAEALFHDPGEVEPLHQSVSSFFTRTRTALGNRTAALALSPGSDSRTVLAGLRRFGWRIAGHTFGRPDGVETMLTRDFAEKYGVPWELTDIADVSDGWEDAFARGTAVTNGLMNPLRVHYAPLYDSIPEDRVIFEGICGSEFVKAEVCIGAMVSHHCARVIKEGVSSALVIDEAFGELDQDFRRRMKSYVVERHGRWLTNVNTEQGLRDYLEHTLGLVPSRVFAGLIPLATRNHAACYPFMSPRVLKSIFALGFGVANSVSLRRNFRGSVDSIRIEAEIVRKTDDELYRSVLDRGISFQEALELPPLLARVIMRLRVEAKTLRYRGAMWGQINNESVLEAMERFVRRNRERLPAVPGLDRFLKEASNLIMVDRIVASCDGRRS